jgi:hypothetical protein
MIICLISGILIGAFEGCQAKGTVGIVPGAIAGFAGALVGAVICSLVILLKYRHPLNFWYMFPGALIGTEGSEFGRPDVSVLAGLVGGTFIGIIVIFICIKYKLLK